MLTCQECAAHEPESGQCRRRPPAAGEVPFPEVAPDWWCAWIIPCMDELGATAHRMVKASGGAMGLDDLVALAAHSYGCRSTLIREGLRVLGARGVLQCIDGRVSLNQE